MADREEWLGKDRYIEAIEAASNMLASVAERDLRRPVPTCPGWSMAALVAHLGEVQRFWALQVRERAQERQSLGDAAFHTCPGLLPWLEGVDAGTPDLDAIPPCLVDWLRVGTAELLLAFRDAGPQEAIWHWSRDNRAITHMRNQAIEATVHRWDGQNALDAVGPIPEDIALDGIEQHFAVQIPASRSWREPRAGSGETFHFHRTDGPGEWLVRFDGEQVDVRHEHAKGDVAVRGPAEDLFLWLWDRIPADRLEIHGDEGLLTRYRELVPGA